MIHATGRNSHSPHAGMLQKPATLARKHLTPQQNVGEQPRFYSNEEADGKIIALPNRDSTSGEIVGHHPAVVGVEYDQTVLGTLYDGNDQSLADIPAFMPTGGVQVDQTAVFINGINTDSGSVRDLCQEAADRFGQPFVGFYNKTQGMAADILESGVDTAGIVNPQTSGRLARLIGNELRQGHEVHLVAQSQGTIITRNALRQVREELTEELGYVHTGGMTQRSVREHNEQVAERVDEMMGNITVETFGGATRDYVSGPRYIHYVNANDPVATLGMRYTDSGAGEGAIIRRLDFTMDSAEENHYFVNYMHHRVPVDQAIKEGSGQF